jgi:hypothetical protein
MILRLLAGILLAPGLQAPTQIQAGYSTLTPDAGGGAPVASALFTYANASGVLVSQAGGGAVEPIRSGRIVGA